MKSPFEDLTPFQRNKLFNLLGVHIFKFAKNEEILPTIKNENIIGIILEGSAQINNIEYNGDEIVSEQLVKDSIFGSNISGTNREDCQIIAKEEYPALKFEKPFRQTERQLVVKYLKYKLKN